MAVSPYDPWDDPATVPAPGAFDYRRGTGYSFTPQDSRNVGLTAAAYPWMSPGVAWAVGRTNFAAPAEIADASLKTAIADGTAYPQTKKRVRENRRQVRKARSSIRYWADWIDGLASGELEPQTTEEIAKLETIGVHEKPKKAREVAANLRAALESGSERDVLRIGKQLAALNTDDEGGLGAFILSPVKGAGQLIGLAASAAGSADTAYKDAIGYDNVEQYQIPGAKTGARYAAAGAQFGADAVAGTLRTVLKQAKDGTLLSTDPEQAIQTTQDIADQSPLFQNIKYGKSLGDGYLPGVDSAAYEAAGKMARAQSPYLIGDHAWTPGRALADLVTDPDDMAFQFLSGFVDGAVALKADPANLGLETIAAARSSNRILTATGEGADALAAAGAMRGIRNRVNVTTARSWVLNEGMPIVQALKANTDALTAWKAFPEIPISVHKRLAAMSPTAPDSDYINVLYGLLGTEIRSPLNTNRVVGGKFLVGSKSKLWATLPPHMIDLTDADEAMRGIEAAGRNLNAPKATIERLQRMIVDSSGSPAQNESIYRATMEMFQEAAVGAGMSRGWAKKWARDINDRLADSRVYDIDEDGIAAHFPFVQVNGKGHALPDPALVTEMRNSAFALPNAHEAKRIVSGLGEFLNAERAPFLGTGLDDPSKAFDAMSSSIDVADKFVGIWKQMVLMRPAWGLRVIAEEQLRMAAAGNFSLFRSPLSAVAWIVGNPADANIAARTPILTGVAGAAAGGLYGAETDGIEGALVGAAVGGVAGVMGGRAVADDAAEAFARLKTTKGRGGSGIGGKSFFDPSDFDEYTESQYGGFRNLLSGQGEKLRTHIYGAIERTSPNAPQAYIEELVRQASDPVVQAVLKTPSLAAVKQSFWNGPLSAQRRFLAQAPDRAGAVAQWKQIGTDRRLADSYVDYVAGRIERVTNRNSDFLDVMRTGKWDGQPVAFKVADNAYVGNPDVFKDVRFVDMVQSQAPEKFRAEQMLTRNDSATKASLARARKLVDSVFDALMPRPSNYLSRSPHFRQKYWERVEELFPELGTDARLSVIADARQANLDDVVKRMVEMDSTVGAAPPRVTSADAAYTRLLQDNPWAGVKWYARPASTVEMWGPYRIDDAPFAGRAVWVDVWARRGDDGNPLMAGRQALDDADRSGTTLIMEPEYHGETMDAIDKVRKQEQLEALYRRAGFEPREIRLNRTGANPEGASESVTQTLWVREPYKTGGPQRAALTAKNADTIAKRYALDETKNLLYDLSEKSQFFDATRLIFPFGEAWKEIITRWATLLADHPNLIRRGQQGVQAARQMTVDPVTGLPDPGGVGMFHRDVTTGEESFVYPLTGMISDQLLGVPIPLKGSVKGLNLIGTGLPGIGPVVQFPLAAILPDTPQWDGVRDLLFPFGEPSGTDVFDVAQSSLLPAWVKKMNQAFANPNVERLQGNVVAQVMQYKLSTGEYETTGPNAQDEINRLFKDAKKAASQFMVFRGVAQALAPTAPTPEFLVKQGPNLVIAAKVAQDYRKRAEKVGWDEAFEWLLETYGPDTALLLAQAKSESLVPGLSASTDQLKWERQNQGSVERYPDVWTMFAPNAGKFDIGGYTQQFQREQRASLTPKEIVANANDRLAKHVYYRQRDLLEGDGKLTVEEEAQLRALKEALRTDFPGYDPDTSSNKVPQYVTQLQDAVKDPALARTPAGRAIGEYLGLRDQAYAEAARIKVSGRGLTSPWTSVKAKPIRDRLFAEGERLRREVDDFRVAWNEVFLYEFKDR